MNADQLRKIRWGDPRITPQLWSRVSVNPGNGCWEWSGHLNQHGYGQTYHASKMWRAHRLFYSLLVSPPPAGLTLDHLCRTRHCVNPNHMEPVSNAENVKRGIGPTAINYRKTHCPQGHPYSGDNLRVIKSTGFRQCRTCTKRHCAAHRARKRPLTELRASK